MPFGRLRISATRVGDLLAEQHAAAAGLGALPDHDLDGVGLAQIVGVHAVARGQALIDEGLASDRAPPRVMPPSPVVVEVPDCDGAAARAPPWRCAESAPKLMPAMVIGIFRCDRLLGEARAEHDVGRAFLAIAFERIARDRGAEEQQIVEMRHACAWRRRRGCRRCRSRRRGGSRRAYSRRRSPSAAAACRGDAPWLSAPSIGVGVVDVEIVELAGRAVAPELRRHRLAVDAGARRAARASLAT